MYIPDFVAIPCAVAAYLQAAPGTSFQFFSGGGQHFDQLPRGGGQNTKNQQNFVVKKHKKSLFTKIRGRGKCPPWGKCPPSCPSTK